MVVLMESEIASAALQRLLGINRSVLNELAKRGIVVRGDKKGTYALEASVGGYCRHNAKSARNTDRRNIAREGGVSQ